ncbi:hypothetical protein HanRHA438_Chr05g0226501 [Helianthus annuus]|nr:hypothetical protein HanRHA438_Chr05g0226501 [Helianthus annuus]
MNFVREHQQNDYLRAVLSFGHVKFLVQLVVRRDPRRPDDNNHLVMHTDWQRIMDQTGIYVGEKLRFEIVEEKSVRGEKIHFEVC